MHPKIPHKAVLTLVFLFLFSNCTYRTSLPSKKAVTTLKTNAEPTKTSSKYYADTIHYKHHVFGTDTEGHTVKGSIALEGNDGIGLLIDHKGTKIEVVLDKDNNNKLTATDVQGYEYELTIE
ncbi:hypothetical protein [Flavobacterium muglaense]|uniref:Uncharacterized protein n=1 Tax=Flavobacterium muglaense TaxID=2764716 RepID=A0A923N171_9FLAO|nr:hypothetical protein [Flavobacterium muglaense]MBC5838936.1 hypothetical protein [Flavobacterium muglaense]MBC5845439.1 hypothetical protein [Flavobacterium muglaense]